MRVKASSLRPGDVVVDACEGGPRTVEKTWVWDLAPEEIVVEFGGPHHVHYRNDERVKIWRGYAK